MLYGILLFIGLGALLKLVVHLADGDPETLLRLVILGFILFVLIAAVALSYLWGI